MFRFRRNGTCSSRQAFHSSRVRRRVAPTAGAVHGPALRRAIANPTDGISRRPARQRLGRKLSRRVWERLSEQAWYASKPVKGLRRELRRFAAGGR